MANKKPIIYAHRGASAYAPENTMDAFRLAVEMGADGFEIDVHRTLDGQIVVCHDDRIDRMSDGQGFAREKTLEELRRYNFSRSLPDYAGRTEIPLLTEVLELCKKYNKRLNIEIKSEFATFPTLEKETVALVRASGIADQVIYSSFNHEALGVVLACDADAYTAPLISARLYKGAEYLNLIGAKAVHPAYSGVSPEWVEGFHKAGKEVNVWTVDAPEAIATMCAYGVDAIISNRPDVALKVIGR